MPNVQIKPGYRVKIRIEAHIESDPTFIENSEYFVFHGFFCNHFDFLKKYCIKISCILMTEFCGAPFNVVPEIRASPLTLVLTPLTV